MKRKTSNFVVITLVMSLLFIVGCESRSAGTYIDSNQPSEFIIAGSGTNLPITGKLAERYNQLEKKNAKVPESIGSSGAIKAVSEGAISLGMISRPLKPKELQQGLKQVLYARVGVVIGTNYNVPDTNITDQDLVNIFKGKKDKWQNGEMIVVLSREKEDSTNRVFVKKVPGFANALEDSLGNKRWKVYYTDTEEAEAVVETPSSIGFTDTGALTALNLKIKPMRFNGIEPTIINVKKGIYPFYKDLYFVYKEPVSERVAGFLNFVSSDEGQRIISLYGGIPMEGK